MSMKYRVHQKFETLGDPCAEIFSSRPAAVRAAQTLTDFIAQMVADMPVEDGSALGWSSEVEAWRAANNACAPGQKKYGEEIGQQIAAAAVDIEEIAAAEGSA